MTRSEFRDYLRKKKCEFLPLNNLTTGNAVKVVNPANGRYYYLTTPFDDRDMIDKQICKACEALIIGAPPEVDCNY